MGSYTCWACVASMVSAYFLGNTNNYEPDIVLFVKGYPVDPNSPAAAGTVLDTEAGVQYVTGINGSCQTTSLSYTSVKYQINNNGPIGAACTSPAHMLCIKGYNDDTTQDVLYNDPADGLGHRCSYDYLINTFGWVNSVFWK